LSATSTNVSTNLRLEQAYSSIQRLWKSPPILNLSEWADAKRKLSPESSAEPGQWYTSRAEYQRGILDAFTDPSIVEVVVMSSAQVGKTEILNNVVGYYVEQDPCPMLIIQPTVDMGKVWSRDRLAPMLRDTPVLQGLVKDPKSRDSGNTIQAKEFPGGRIAIGGANSPAGLASRPVRLVLLDEIDRFPPSAGSEGDPVRLAIKRAQTFWNRKVGKFSTPTVKGASRVEQEWDESDQRRFHVPCPFCAGHQILRWGQIKFVKDDKGRPVDVHYECEHCNAKLYEVDKLRMVRNGQWIAERPEVKGKAGFHLNELYSPWSAWQKVVEDFLEAKKRPETLKVWVNTSLGETWEEEGLTVDDGSLLGRREEYTAQVPLGVAVLTAGVDVQDDRLLVKVKGWGRGEESWLIDWITIPGRPETDPKVWADLDAVLSRVWAHELGTTLRVAAACIDSGGHATKQAYDFARTRGHRRIFAIKGVGGPGTPVIKLSTRKNKGGIALGLVGADTCKGLIYSRLQVDEYGPGYMHFPRRPEVDEEYFKQLTAEKQITKFNRGFPTKVWTKMRARNEALDCEAYSLAALATLNANLDQLAQRIEEQAEFIKAPVKEPDPTVSSKALFRPQPPTRKGWSATKW